MDSASFGGTRSLSTLEKERTDREHESYNMISEPGEPESHPPLTFADLGIPTSEHVQDTVIGKSRSCRDVTWNEWLYIICMLVSILVAAGFTIYRLTKVQLNDPDFTFCLVLLWNAVFCVWFVLDGILRERPSEIFILSIATVIITCYLIVNYIAGTQNEIKLSRMIAACVLSPLLVLFGLRIAWTYHVSKRLIFRVVGANEHLQTLYRNLLTFQDFLKFDLQLGGSMVLFIVLSFDKLLVREIVILSVGGAVTIIWFILGYFAMPKENKILAVIFFLFSPAEIAYICYKLYDVSCYINSLKGLAGATIACGIIALVVRFLVIVGAILVVKEFKQGLKEKLNS
ncbi:hypothetical protein BgiMline_020265 [Biomphalaria glabrata]